MVDININTSDWRDEHYLVYPPPFKSVLKDLREHSLEVVCYAKPSPFAEHFEAILQLLEKLNSIQFHPNRFLLFMGITTKVLLSTLPHEITGKSVYQSLLEISIPKTVFIVERFIGNRNEFDPGKIYGMHDTNLLKFLHIYHISIPKKGLFYVDLNNLQIDMRDAAAVTRERILKERGAERWPKVKPEGAHSPFLL